jgi:hypothetical protein
MIGQLITTGNTYDAGMNAINTAFSGQASFNAFSAETMVSGSTNLYDIFSTTDTNDITRIQNGLNTYTGGTGNNPTVNISAATLDTLSVSGASSLGVVSATTIYSGSTNLYDIFLTTDTNAFQTLTDAATIVWGVDISLNAIVTLGGNRDLNITGLTDGCSGTLIVKQDGSGNRNLFLSGTTGTHKIVNGGGGSLIFSSGANEEDIISFVYYLGATTFYWNIGYNYN